MDSVSGGAGCWTSRRGENAGWWCAPKKGKHARATLQRQVERDRTTWTQRLWHLGHQPFACQADAEAALAKVCQRLPAWVQIQTRILAVPKHAKPGRPRKEEAIIALYHEQTVVEKGFAFLKDPLFLASSVFVKKPERIMAIAFIMVLCLLVYKVAELRIRQRLVATGQTVPDQVRKPSARPTMRWLFQCFEGLDLHHTVRSDGTWETEILRLTDLHRQILHLLGPAFEKCYLAGEERVE